MCVRVSRLIFKGLPEGIAQMRREKATELVMFGPRITLQRHKRRLIEVRYPVGAPLCVACVPCRASLLLALPLPPAARVGYCTHVCLCTWLRPSLACSFAWREVVEKQTYGLCLLGLLRFLSSAACLCMCASS